jgi:hypothetical protein
MINHKRLSGLLDAVRLFEPRCDGNDDVWEFHFPIGRTWHVLGVRRYGKSWFLGGPALEQIETDERGRVDPSRALDEGLVSQYGRALAVIYKKVAKDPVGYHIKLTRSLPLKYRQGIISRKFVHRLLPEYMRFDKELTRREKRDMIACLRGGKSVDPLKKMTSGIYFDYVRQAYLSNPKTRDNKTLSGREMYKKWADGRDEGLTQLPLNDAAAFERWYRDGSRMGGHPWEVFRGGNSTHINLSVTRDFADRGWEIHLEAFSSTRLAETCRSALAFLALKKPFVLDHKESYLLRLTAGDNVGILPEGSGLKYGWHEFPKEFNVADCIYYSWFKDDESGKSLRPLREIAKLITWFPLEPLMPR